MFYAIGDIHGQYDLLRKLYTAILQDIVDRKDLEPNTIVFLGDYIDRGPKNVQTLDFLKNLQDMPGTLEHVLLWGNHEQMFMEAMQSPRGYFMKLWLENGGLAFLKETGNDVDYFVNSFPWHAYVNWFEAKFELYLETEDYVFCHGGLDIRKEPLDQQFDTVIWARNTQQDWYRDYPKMVIHGHSPVGYETKDYWNPVVDCNRINMDTTWASPKQLMAVALPNRRADAEPRFLRVMNTD